MVPAQRRQLPSSAGDVQLRRLGPRKASDSPIRGQVVVALVLGMILIGVPMYFMRRPSVEVTPAAAGSAKPVASTGVLLSPLDAGVAKVRVRVADAQRIKCSSSPKQRGNEGLQCDPLPAFERLLKKAILAEIDCAPQAGAGSINFVANINFADRSLKVFPGKSGSWAGPQAKRATECVQKFMAPIKWESIAHRYRFYTLAMSATYSPPKGQTALPTFE